MAPRKSKQQVTEADKSPAAAGELVTDTGTVQDQAKPDAPTVKESVTEPEAGTPAAEKEPGVQDSAAEQDQEKTVVQEPAAEQRQDEQSIDDDVDLDLAAEDADLIVATADTNQPDWVIGHMDVKAKSPIGFWRCGYFFARDMATRVYVVTRREDVTQAAGHDDFAVYVEEAEAKRIYREPNLVILIDGEIIRG